MPTYVFHYSQGKDIRWYASEPVHMHATPQSANAAIANKRRVTTENGQFVEWAETSTTFGVCYALATYWVIKKANGEDFLQWLKPGSRACQEVGANANPGAGQTVADVKQLQVGQKGKLSSVKLYDALTRVQQETGLVSRDSIPVKRGELKNKQGFSLIVITGDRTNANANDFGGQGDFNHAIAVYVIDEANVLLFDPNRGEIKLNSVAETNAFIKYLCTASNQYHLRRYELEWAAVASQRIKKGSFR